MTRKKQLGRHRKPTTPRDHVAKLDRTGGLTDAEIKAMAAIAPVIRHAAVSKGFADQFFVDRGEVGVFDVAEALRVICDKARKGSEDLTTDILITQAVTLDATFTDMLRRASLNFGQYPEAAERYMRMAMKAQANCRVTLEALTKVQRGGEQIVKHVHVDNRGGQAVIAETINSGGGPHNGKYVDQCQATGATAAGVFASLPGANPLGAALPITSGEGEAAVQDARRDQSGSTEGQPQCMEARR